MGLMLNKLPNFVSTGSLSHSSFLQKYSHIVLETSTEGRCKVRGFS